MKHQYALDLRVARRKSGLTQQDCGHLLGIDATRITRFESGKRPPSVAELAMLCFICGIPLAEFADRIVEADASLLQKRLIKMPDCPKNWPDHETRANTLRELVEKLEQLNSSCL
jgi:transcriptional regulator with XRE-family HTH domain